MITLSWCRRLLAVAVVLTSGLALAFAGDGKPARQQQQGDDIQDLVFLGDARPVLIRLHVRLDGKTIQTAWDDYLKELFAYLDVNGDGVLDAVEAERVPSIEQIQGGVLAIFAGRGRASRAKMQMTKEKASKQTATQKDAPVKKAGTDKESKKQVGPPAPSEARKETKPKPVSPPPSAKAGKDSKSMPAPPKAAPAPPIELPSMLSELDANKDGKVTLAELSAYYRKSGFNPFRVHLSTPQPNPLAQIGYARGGAEPTAEAVSSAIFALLDTNRDGKLSKQELAAAPDVLLRLDEDEDEMITTRELAPNTGSSASSMIAGFMSKGKASGANESRKTLIPLPRPGEVPGDLVKALQTRYGPKAKKPEEKKLTCKDLGLDEATFRRLDTNGDGVLDSKELAGFVKRPPDIELTVRLGEKQENEAAVQAVTVKGQPTTLAGKLTVKDDTAMLDLGVTRAEIRASDEEMQMDALVGILRAQLTALFKAADKGNKGYLDKEDIKKNIQARQLENIFALADRDNDGKLTEKELTTFLDKVLELQARATASSATLVLSFDSRGLFDLLDSNGDSKLSIREMRGAVGLLEKFDRQKKGYLTKADIPLTARLTLKRGPSGDADPQLAVFAALYGGGNSGKGERVLTAGPFWFRKMDRNRDGDVSRKEWIFSDELFRKIDTDGDGLISLEEAQRYEATRKEK